MKNCGGCSSWIPDDASACPSCGRAQDGSAPPPPPPPPPAPEPEREPEGAERLAFIRARSAARVRTLGLLYIVYGALLIGMVAVNAANQMSGETLAGIEQMRELWPPEYHDLVDRIEGLYRNPTYLLFAHFIPFALGAAMVWGGIQLRGLRGRTGGIALAVALLVLSLCESCCCCLGVPLGVWALMVLTSGQTRVVMET